MERNEVARTKWRSQETGVEAEGRLEKRGPIAVPCLFPGNPAYRRARRSLEGFGRIQQWRLSRDSRRGGPRSGKDRHCPTSKGRRYGSRPYRQPAWAEEARPGPTEAGRGRHIKKTPANYAVSGKERCTRELARGAHRQIRGNRVAASSCYGGQQEVENKGAWDHSERPHF
ncbi:hypothetical protein NDU88_003777 [Pleurodeles waltl]|uniref:Uncharacterized protein n=1 Tax=Pleurodeles waltl TaxID=8319 RepID=A0AAV7KZG9_PLEWA|nr:hypothetical protein NDU88_003777 [Pleurodeles waltl]